MLKRAVAVFALVALAAPAAFAAPQSQPVRLEEPVFRHAYDLSRFRILVIAAPAFNPEETIEMSKRWKDWGARVEFASPTRVVTGEVEGPTAAAPVSITVDHLLGAVNPDRYDLVYIAGGEGVGSLLEGPRTDLARVLDGADRAGRIVAAICHGPLALSASTLVKGKRMTVQGGAGRRALQEAGALLVDEVAVVDGRLVTGQWPHLETFAMTVAERLQYPTGDGPFRRWLDTRSPIVRAIEDQRATQRFDGRAVPPDTLEQIVRLAMKALAPPSTPGARAMKLVVVREPALRTSIASRIFERCKEDFAARGVPNEALRQQLTALVDQAPALVFLLVQNDPAASIVSDTNLRANVTYGGALSANLVLAGRSAGLGVTPLGLPLFLKAEPEIKQALSAPDTAVLVNILAIGYSTMTGTPAVSRPASDVVSFERWNR